VGTVLQGAAEFKSARIRKKDQRHSFVEELLADTKVKHYAKRKFLEINRGKTAGGKRSYKKRRAALSRR